MILALWLTGLCLIQDTVPFKSNEEFELTLDHKFRNRIVEGADSDHREYRNTGPLPFLSLSLKVLKAHAQEERIRIVDNERNVVLYKKIEPGQSYTFDAGFTVDMKDRVKPHEFTIWFMSKDRKQTVSRIVIHVAEDGTFIVNDQKRGKL